MRGALRAALSAFLCVLTGCGAEVVHVGREASGWPRAAPTPRDHARGALFREVVAATESAVPGAVVTGVRVLPTPATSAAEVTFRDGGSLHTIVVDLEAMTPIPSSRAPTVPELGESIPSGSLRDALAYRVLSAETDAVRVTDLAGRSVTVEESVVGEQRHVYWDLGSGCADELWMVGDALARRDRAAATARGVAPAGQ